jgi:hypothetical protein
MTNDIWKIYLLTPRLYSLPFSDYLINDFREFVNALAANDPARGQKRSSGEALTGTRQVRQHDLISS